MPKTAEAARRQGACTLHHIPSIRIYRHYNVFTQRGIGVSHRQKIDIIDKRRQSKIKCGENIGQLLYIIERTFEKERENMEEAERENIILWIIDQVRQMPLGLLKQVRGFIRGITKP